MLLALSGIGKAQNQVFLNEKFTINGLVTDSQTGKPIEYATVSLFSETDSLITGTVCNVEGVFILTELKKINYHLSVDFIGYKKLNINNIQTNSSSESIQVDVKLQRAEIELDEVNITGHIQTIDYKIDKKVINVGKNLTAEGGTAVDVLKTAPSVQVDLEGNVTMRGSSDFAVLIDGRPSVLSGSDALSMIPAGLIQNIEIITNPSVKFNPEGTAGIINIITKQEKSEGMAGIINVSAGNAPEYSSDMLLKYSSKKFSLTGSLDYSNRNDRMTGNSYRETYLQTDTQFLSTSAARNMQHVRYSARGIAEYYFSKIHTFSVQAEFSKMGLNFNSSTSNNLSWQKSEEQKFYFTDEETEISPVSKRFQITDFYKFNDKGHELKINFDYGLSSENKNETIQQFLFSPEYQSQVKYEDIVINSSENQNRTNANFDYVLPINTYSQLEAGFQTSLYKSKTDYSASYLYVDSINANENDRSELVRDIYAAYSTYSQKIGKFDVKVGIRAEYMNQSISQLIVNKKYDYRKFSFFPSMYFTYSLPNSDQIQLSYSRRLNRPSERDLNPYIMFTDGFTLMKGNPALEPEYANLAELNYMKKLKIGFLSFELFYRETNNKMTRYSEINDAGVLVLTWKNLNRDYSLGSEISTNLEIAKWWSVMIKGSVFQYKLTGEYLESEVVKESFNWESNLMNQFSLKSGTSLQLMLMYKSPSVTVDGNMSGMFLSDLGLKQELFKHRLSVSFSVRDIFNTAKMNINSQTNDYYISNQMSRKAPIFMIKLGFRINNYKQEHTNPNSEGDYNIYMN